MEKVFIDKFIVPEKAEQEFKERLNINRNFIKKLPGFIEDAAYKRTHEDKGLVYMTVAIWENDDALDKAKAAVHDEYKRTGFNMAEMFARLNITMERDVYQPIKS